MKPETQMLPAQVQLIENFKFMFPGVPIPDVGSSGSLL